MRSKPKDGRLVRTRRSANRTKSRNSLRKIFDNKKIKTFIKRDIMRRTTKHDTSKIKDESHELVLVKRRFITLRSETEDTQDLILAD